MWHGRPTIYYLTTPRGLALYTPGEFVLPTWSNSVLQRQTYPFGSGASQRVPMLRCVLRGLSGLGDQNVLPAGSRLSYSVKWTGPTFVIDSPADIAAKIGSILSGQWGIVIDSEQDTSNFFVNQSGFTLQVHTTRDYGQPDDIKSIIDGEIYRAGRSVVSSTIAVTQSPEVQILAQQNIADLQKQLSNAVVSGDTAAADRYQGLLNRALAMQAGGGAPGQSFTDFLTQNVVWIVAGVVATVVLTR